MVARISALVVWALVAATVVFWGLRLFARSPLAPPTAVAVGDSTALRGDLGRLFGAPPAEVVAAPVPIAEAASRFRLVGVMAPPRHAARSGAGVALIAVDGKPPRAFAVGTPLDESLVLQSVSLRAASIGPANGPSAMTLEMPPLQPAATGVLPPSGGVPVPAARSVPSYQPVQTPVQLPVLGPGQGPPPPPGGIRVDANANVQAQ